MEGQNGGAGPPPAGPETFSLPYDAPNGDLKQGDLLAKTSAVEALLAEVHPYYLAPSYTHFLVLTQTCDLVVRGTGSVKSRYITIAGVRPLELAVRREIEKLQTNEFQRVGEVAAREERARLLHFLERVMNQNVDEYFFLLQEPRVGLHEDSCAFLRLTIPLRWEEHISKCLEARILSLNDVFRAKLGWMVGSVYSRVGVPDLIGSVMTKPEFQDKTRTLLDGICNWVERKRLKRAAETADRDLLAGGRDAVLRHIKSTEVPSPLDELVTAFMTVSKEQGVFEDNDQAGALRSQLLQDPRISAALKRALRDRSVD